MEVEKVLMSGNKMEKTCLQCAPALGVGLQQNCVWSIVKAQTAQFNCISLG